MSTFEATLLNVEVTLPVTPSSTGRHHLHGCCILNGNPITLSEPLQTQMLKTQCKCPHRSYVAPGNLAQHLSASKNMLAKFVLYQILDAPKEGQEVAK